MRCIYTIYTKYHYKNIFPVTLHGPCIFSTVPTTPKRSRQSAAPVVSNVGTRCIASCQVSMKNCFSVSKNCVNVGHTRKCKRSTIHTIHYPYYHNRKLFLCACWTLSSTHMIGRNLIIAFSKKHYNDCLHWRSCLCRNCSLGNKLFLVSGLP